MIDLTVKTLDSKNHTYSVPDDITVRQFKEKVANSVGIPSDKQRLIYCGRVLQDDKKLIDYDVNGKVIHLVQRPPPAANRPTASMAGSTSSQTAAGTGHAHHPPTFAHRLNTQDGNSFLLGAFTIPSDVVDPNQVQTIVQQVVSGMGEFGRNATIMSRTSDDGSTVDVHINLGQVPLQGETRQRINSARTMIRRANVCLDRLENPSGSSGNSSQTSPNTEEATADDRNASTTQGVPNSATASTSAANDEDDEISVESFGEGLAAMAGIIEGEIFIRPTIALPGGGGTFPVIADAARMAATTALAAAMTEPPTPAGSGSSRASPDGLSAQPLGSTPEGTSAAGTTTQPSQPQANGQQRVAQPTHAPILASLMEELATLQSRLQPHLLQYQTILREDVDLQGNNEEQAKLQRTFNLVSEALHFVSHAYHTVSDIMVDMAQTPPRTLRSRSLVAHHPALVQAAMPLQAQINIGGFNASAAMQAAAAAAASGNAATSTNGAPTAASSGNATPADRAPTETPTSASNEPSPVAAGRQVPNGNDGTPAAGSGQPTANVPHSFGIPAQMAGFFQSQNPVVFMELGPGSITASVVSETINGQPVQISGHRFPGGVFPQAPPQDLIQNLMQAVGQATTVRNGNNGQSQARGNTATQPTTSTQTRSTSRPIQTIPIALPGLSHPSFDAYLPCSSHHVAHVRRPIIPLRNLAQQQQGNAAANRPTDTQLAGIVANLMSALFSSPPAGATTTATPGATTPGGGASSSSSSSTTAGAAAGPTSSGRGGMQQLGRVRRMLGELLSLRRNVGDTTQNSTIADFLRTLPDYSYQEGEGLISDLVMTVARRLSLREFVEVLFGRSEILNRLRTQLQEFVRGRVLHGLEASEDNVLAAVREMANSTIEVARVSVQDIDIREAVDYFSTLRRFFEEHLTIVIGIIMSAREEDFGTSLYAACRQIISEHVVLNMYCFRNGQRALERMVQNTVRQIAVDLDPFILQWMVGMCTVQIRAMLPNITTRDADIIHYVVRDGAVTATTTASVSSPPTVARAATNNVLEQPTTQVDPTTDSPMESASSLPEIAPLVAKVSNKTSGAAAAPRLSLPSEAETMEATTGAIPMDTGESNFPPTNGSWQGAVPVDWVPIIAEDVQQQRRQSIQRPFSDAYVSTMPSKRRKMMNGERLHTMVESGGVLSDTLQRAIGVAGAQPTTSLDAVIGDVSSNVALNSAFQGHLHSSVRNRLSADKDFCPQKFPNADIVFRCQQPEGDP